MANPYDQFDAAASPVANPYDQFDVHPAPPQVNGAAPSQVHPEQAGGGISAQVMKGIPVVGGLAQKGAAAANAALDPVVAAVRHWRGAPELPDTQGPYGERYAHHLDELRAADAATKHEHPIGSAALQAAGGLGAFGAARNIGGLPAISQPPVGAAILGGTTGGLARRMATSGAANAVLGGADAATRDQDIGTGAATSGALGVAGPLAGRMVGSAVNRWRGTTQAAVPPTGQALRDAGDAGYQAARGTGLVLHGQHVADLSHIIEQDLLQRFNPQQAPETFGILHRMQAAPPGSTVDANGLMAVREQLANAARNHMNPREAAAAGPAIEHLDDYLTNTIQPHHVAQGDPAAFQQAYGQARANYGAGMRSERADEVARHAETSAASTGSGANVNNKQRQGWNQVLRRDALRGNTGLNDAELAQADRVVRGTPVGNTLRRTSTVLGGGGGLGRLHAGGMGAAAGGLVGGPVGAAVGGLAAPAVGAAARWGAERSTQRGLNTLDEMIRRRAPLSAPANAAHAQMGATNNAAMDAGALGARAAGTPIAQLLQQILGANQ